MTKKISKATIENRRLRARIRKKQMSRSGNKKKSTFLCKEKVAKETNLC